MFYEPLHDLIDRAFGPPVVLADALGAVPGIRFAAVFGSYAARRAGEDGPAPRDVDVLVVGDVDATRLYEAVDAAEDDVALPVNMTVMTVGEWAADTGFTRQLRSRPLLPLIGEAP